MQSELDENIIVNSLATKEDIAYVEVILTEKISDVRQEVSNMKTELTEKIYGLKDDLKKQFMWFITTLIAMTRVIITVIKPL